MKFILIERKLNEDTVHIIPFIFPKEINHIDMYNCAKDLIAKQFGKSLVRCVSAGFYNQVTEECFGESTTLKIGCHPKTTDVLKMINYFYLFHIEKNPFNQ